MAWEVCPLPSASFLLYRTPPRGKHGKGRAPAKTITPREAEMRPFRFVGSCSKAAVDPREAGLPT
ncbi:hypothetical protein LZ30DRAFT_741627 [Colletotrichum cereale]|nr:hypothetical protein LZ30DRAFT_741627 [Colletotrichum cereale]